MQIEEIDGKFIFNRFTKEEEELYRRTDEGFHMKTTYTSGVKFYFKTSSKTLHLKVNVPYGSIRKFFSFDLFVNDESQGRLALTSTIRQ